MNSKKLQIQLTRDPSDFNLCAKMMTMTDPWITLGMSTEECLDAFRGDFREIYILKSDRTIAGFIILQVSGTFSGYIQTICIDEHFRGKGFGTSLIEFSERRIHEFSPNIFICVSTFNEGAKRLYLRYGFKPVGVLENFVKNGYDELLMRKTIGQRVGYKHNPK
jgi:[ribosomal protein S18]-alanine N-acetyltransferase